MTEITKVKGIGAKTAIKLHEAGIDSAEELANSEIDQLVQIIGRATAKKIIQNARDLLGDETPLDDRTEKTVKPVKEVKEVKEPAPQPVAEFEDSNLGALKGVGPKTQNDLSDAGYTTVSKIASATIDDLLGVKGIGKATAQKIMNSAMELIGDSVEAITEEKPEATEAQPEPEVQHDVDESGVRTRHDRSPLAMGIPTRKKGGVQIAKTEKIDLDALERVDKPSGWVVKSRELSEEEKEAKRKRQLALSQRDKITREIPTPPKPVKAIKDEAKVAKSERPVKKPKKAKAELAKKVGKKEKKAKVITHFVADDLVTDTVVPKVRGATAKPSGESKPRISLDRNTYLGKITSKRRSRRVINNRQVIVKLQDDLNPDQLVGQKIYFTYPEGKKMSGSISKRFGKQSSGKVLVNFKSGVREEAVHQKIYTY